MPHPQLGTCSPDLEFSAPGNSFLWVIGALEEQCRECTGFLIMPKRPFRLKLFLFKPVCALRDRSCLVLAFSFCVTSCSDGPERLDPSRGALAVDPRPETQSEQWPMQSGRSPSAAQVPGKPPVKGTVEEWSCSSTSRRCECSQGSRVGHGSSRSRGWRHQSRSRSSVEACRRTAQGCESWPCSGLGGHIRGSACPGAEIGSRSPRNDRFPRSGSRCFASSSDTRQSCRGPTSSECAGDTVPTIHRADCEAHRGAGQSEKPSPDGCSSDRPAAPDMALEVVRLQDQVAHLQAQLATRVSEGVPATVVCPDDNVQESPSKKGKTKGVSSSEESTRVRSW